MLYNVGPGAERASEGGLFVHVGLQNGVLIRAEVRGALDRGRGGGGKGEGREGRGGTGRGAGTDSASHCSTPPVYDPAPSYPQPPP